MTDIEQRIATAEIDPNDGTVRLNLEYVLIRGADGGSIMAITAIIIGLIIGVSIALTALLVIGIARLLEI